MSEFKDRLLKQLETSYSENARECLEIYEALADKNCDIIINGIEYAVCTVLFDNYALKVKEEYEK